MCAAQPVRLYSRGGGGGAPREKREGGSAGYFSQASVSLNSRSRGGSESTGSKGRAACRPRKKRKTQTHTRKGFPSVKVFLEALTTSPSEKSPFRFDCRHTEKNIRRETNSWTTQVKISKVIQRSKHILQKNSLFRFCDLNQRYEVTVQVT